ncbi:MAG: DUF1553 domain-containing protein [Phycisphaeraceae bacterium]
MMPHRPTRHLMTFTAAFAAAVLMLAMAGDPASAAVDFQRDIEPILAENCYDCHGDRRQRGGLRLDYRNLALLGGDSGAAVEAGNPDHSRLITRVVGGDDEAERMPPDGPYLDEEEVELLRAWIDEGAAYPEARMQSPRRQSEHWSFQPIADPELPQVDHADWVKNSVDRFVLAKLEEAGVRPSEEADRYTLIRRLSLDLTGLPPTVEEVEAFVNDRSENAYERVVDRLLASPHYGERWGRHWLDEARYADSDGYSIDGPRQIWLYRDWVINAINADMPFDQFTVEQLAGDLLENPTPDQLVATGFHRNTLVNQEGGSDAEQFRVESVVDRANTTGAVWLGLTMACAECHTHKFDPITQREYFQLYAFFNGGADKNSHQPTMKAPTAAQQRELASIKAEREQLQAALTAYDAEVGNRQADWEATLNGATRWQDVAVVAIDSEAGASFETLDDGTLLASGNNGDSDVYTLTLRGPVEQITAIRLETLTHESLPRNGPGRAGNGNFVLNGFEVNDSRGEAVNLVGAEADHSQPDYHISAAIDGSIDTGWAINVPGGNMNVDRTAVFRLAEPIQIGEDTWQVVMRFGPQPAGYQIGRFRLQATDAATPLGPETQQAAEIAAIDPDDRTEAQRQMMARAFASSDSRRAELTQDIERLDAQRDQIRNAVPSTLVMRELDEPRPSHVHVRGDFLRKGEAVEPGTPEVLPPLEVEDDRRATRLDLAKWLVDRENPLTARVRVNRIWMHYFGKGLVETENDFGLQGTPPTHPELLNWLAIFFMDNDWSMKALHRKIVTSATYRQSSTARPELAEIDPLNKLLGRQERVRVEAEIVRDQALVASGMLTTQIGGPSVHPPQADGVYAFTQNRRQWPESKGDDRYRRTMYTFFYRSAPYPLLSTFDAPNFNTTCTARARSNTPLQSLTVANSQAIYELAQAMGGRVLREHDEQATDRERITSAFRWAVARPPTGEELARLHSFVRHQRDAFEADPEAAKEVAEAGPAAELNVAPAELAAWTALSRVLINLDEFITRP